MNFVHPLRRKGQLLPPPIAFAAEVIPHLQPLEIVSIVMNAFKVLAECPPTPRDFFNVRPFSCVRMLRAFSQFLPRFFFFFLLSFPLSFCHVLSFSHPLSSFLFFLPLYSQNNALMLLVSLPKSVRTSA